MPRPKNPKIIHSVADYVLPQFSAFCQEQQLTFSLEDARILIAIAYTPDTLTAAIPQKALSRLLIDDFDGALKALTQIRHYFLKQSATDRFNVVKHLLTPVRIMTTEQVTDPGDSIPHDRTIHELRPAVTGKTDDETAREVFPRLPKSKQETVKKARQLLARPGLDPMIDEFMRTGKMTPELKRRLDAARKGNG